jgi:signal peptidase I
MEMRKPLLRFWREWVRPSLVVVAILGSFRSAVADWNDVPSGSMRPTILEGDRIFVNKLAYDLKVPFTTWHILEWSAPERGDIVVFFSPFDGKRLVKRVVAMGGDLVELRDNHLIVNGQPARYAPIGHEGGQDREAGLGPTLVEREDTPGRSHLVRLLPSNPGMPNVAPFTVPRGHYFVMGDNRDQSFDSRFWGFVERKRIVGRATTVIGSLDRPRSFWPRWSRFLSPLV